MADRQPLAYSSQGILAVYDSNVEKRIASVNAGPIGVLEADVCETAVSARLLRIAAACVRYERIFVLRTMNEVFHLNVENHLCGVPLGVRLKRLNEEKAARCQRSATLHLDAFASDWQRTAMENFSQAAHAGQLARERVSPARMRQRSTP